MLYSWREAATGRGEGTCRPGDTGAAGEKVRIRTRKTRRPQSDSSTTHNTHQAVASTSSWTSWKTT
ncbi:hypothetical protein E2C01_014038 [Portunus trituberculatus]|uniref:Uncharacterized protein n=1 Tax=Portunus trituberculatus TaxID=210409 RepID=A0A5B7DIV7_PORTR|nr:hypothetical protein [Portunus trituberculatus]